VPKPPREVVVLVAGELGREDDGANAALVPGVAWCLASFERLPEFQNQPRPPDQDDDDRHG
jgi:hypothetical protein